MRAVFRRAFARLRASQFARDAAILVVLNAVSRALGFFGNAYAAKCLGPVYLGVSALVQTTASPVALAYNGGFDTVAVRKIAADPEKGPTLTAAIVVFRLLVALLTSLIWFAVSVRVADPDQRFAWMLGIPCLLFPAVSLAFVFQGLERLPIQSAISTGGVLLSTTAYFLLFKPGMFLGADLLVLAVVGAIAAVASWLAYWKILGHWPVVRARWIELRNLFGESWRYWVLAVAVYCYSAFQIPLIAYLLGSREAGVYRSAFFLASGVELLFNSINVLLLPRLVVWKAAGLEIMWRKQVRLLQLFLGIGLPPTIVLIMAARFIYNVFLGPAFLDGVIVFQILIAGRLVVFLGQIYAWGLAAVGADADFLHASLLGAASSVILNLLLIPAFGLVASAVVSVVAELLIHGTCFWSLRRIVQMRPEVSS